jgi:hypothetical protein
VLEDYIRLFPDTPILPRIRSINILMDSRSCLPYFIRSSTPGENQPSVSASVLRSLSIYRRESLDDPAAEEEGEGLARDLAAFQRSNGKLGGGLETFRDFPPLSSRGWEHSPAGCEFQKNMQNALVLRPLETADWPARGLRRLEVIHYPRELPGFFGRVARMDALSHLKIAIADERDFLEPEEESDESDGSEAHSIQKHPFKIHRPDYEGIRHSASSLEIEGFWRGLSSAIHRCAPPSAATQFRSLRLLYYLRNIPRTRAAIVRVLDLPADIIPPDHLQTLVVCLLDRGGGIPSSYRRMEVGAFRPLLRYKRMVKLHLELPCNIPVDLEFLHALGAVMGETLRHFVMSWGILVDWDDGFGPVLTAGDLPIIAGAIMPRLETLGLDVRYDEISVSGGSSVVSSALQNLYVGMNRINEARISQVATFLKEHFPRLQRLRHNDSHSWPRVVQVNGYNDRLDGPWC